MKITIEILKKAKKNNATKECIDWLIDTLDEQINLENIEPLHYLWLTSIGCIPNVKLMDYCIKKEIKSALKYALHHIDNDFLEYCTRIAPKETIYYASHRLTPSALEICKRAAEEEIAYVDYK